MRVWRPSARALLLAMLCIAALTAAQRTATADRSDAVVSVSHADAGPYRACTSISLKDLEAHGGCKLTASSKRITFAVLTALGDNALARCEVMFSLFISGDGRLAVDDLAIGARNPFLDGACGDILPCRRDTQLLTPEQKVPWGGRLVTGKNGSVVAHIDACFDTCVGRMKGRTELPLSRSARGALRLRAARSPVGLSGFEMDGTWELRPPRGGKLRIATP
jgi:hypothetical protein